jgi:hypothetical protein
MNYIQLFQKHGMQVSNFRGKIVARKQSLNLGENHVYMDIPTLEDMLSPSAMLQGCQG